MQSSAGASGQAQFEFILSILTVLFVIFWIWELVMAVYTINVLSDSAKEGVRCAIVQGGSGCPAVAGCPLSDNIQCRVWDYARFSLHDVSGMTVTITYPDGNFDIPNRIRIEVAYPFVPYTALPVTPTLHATAEGRRVY